MKNLRKAASVLCVALNEVSIQIIIASVATKAIFFRPILIRVCAGVSIQRSADIVERNDCDNDVLSSRY